MIIRAAFMAALLTDVLAIPAAADSTLSGRTVTFTVLIYDNHHLPMLKAVGRTVTVGQCVEFGLDPKGVIVGMRVVPVQIEISPTRLQARYNVDPGVFYDARFNGYVLIFETDCALFDHVRIDHAFTTMPLEDRDVWAKRGGLLSNVAGKQYGPNQRFALDFDVVDCPLS